MENIYFFLFNNCMVLLQRNSFCTICNLAICSIEGFFPLNQLDHLFIFSYSRPFSF